MKMPGSIILRNKVKKLEMLSGGDILIRCLQEENVDYVFGYPGGAVLHIYDALFRQDRIKHILVRHEQAATHMADG
ncbi:MAG: acetolactate synthase-1/2/3 large subunit, partial [Urechidicola sp.]